MAHRSDFDPNDNDAGLWREAQTLADLGHLTARWLEGDISYMPGVLAAGPDPETDGLMGVLAAANRASFVTVFSQPGEDSDGWSQRAAVHGFCDEAMADRIRESVLETSLISLEWPPGTTGECRKLVVTREGRRENTWAGDPLEPSAIGSSYSGDLSPKGIRALLGAYQVVIIDPQWGRNDLLWVTLAAAVDGGGLRRSADRSSASLEGRHPQRPHPAPGPQSQTNESSTGRRPSESRNRRPTGPSSDSKRA